MNDSSFKYWILAIRPKTLAASAVPVTVACALAFKDGTFKWIPGLICLTFALLIQIVSNLFNDYSDFKKGSDRSDRLGPQRAVAQGWVSPQTMLRSSILLLLISCLLGLSLVWYAGWQLIIVGIIVCIGALAYSAGPYPLAYRGWGDICVIIFYGLVPVGFTYYVQTLSWTPEATICGISIGFVTTNILVSNNYRDREQDKISGKNTTIVLFGERFGEYFYLFNGIAAALLCIIFLWYNMLTATILPIFYLIPHIKTWKKMCHIKMGKELNNILEQSARNTIIFGTLLLLGILLSLG